MKDPAAGPLTRFLSEDHVRLDGLLRRAAAGPEGVDASAFDEFRRGLLRHIGMEEKVLLPEATRRRGGKPLPAAERLRTDHSALATLLVTTPTPAIVETIRRILEAHNPVEEGPAGVYAEVERLMSAEEAVDLVARLRARDEPPVSPYSDNPRVLDLVRALVERYRDATGGGPPNP